MNNYPDELYQALSKMKNATRRYSDHSKIEQRISESFRSRGFELNEGQASELRQALLSNQLRDVVNQALITTGLVVVEIKHAEPEIHSRPSFESRDVNAKLSHQGNIIEIEGMILTDQEPEDNEGVSLNVGCVTINNEKHYSQQALGEAHTLLSTYLAKPLATLYLSEGTALPLSNMPTIRQAFKKKGLTQEINGVPKAPLGHAIEGFAAENVVSRMQEIHNEMKNLHATLVRDDNAEGGLASNLEASMDSLELSIDHGLHMIQDEPPKPRR